MELRADVARGPEKDFSRRVNRDPQSPAVAASWQAGYYSDAPKNGRERADKGDAGAEAWLGKTYYEGVA